MIVRVTLATMSLEKFTAATLRGNLILPYLLNNGAGGVAAADRAGGVVAVAQVLKQLAVG